MNCKPITSSGQMAGAALLSPAAMEGKRTAQMPSRQVQESSPDARYRVTPSWVMSQLSSTVRQARLHTRSIVALVTVGLYWSGAIKSWPVFFIGAPLALWLGVTGVYSGLKLIQIYREGKATLCREAIIKTLLNLKVVNLVMGQRLCHLRESRERIEQLAPFEVDWSGKDGSTVAEQEKTRKLKSRVFSWLCDETRRVKRVCGMKATEEPVESYDRRLKKLCQGSASQESLASDSIAARLLGRKKERAMRHQGQGHHTEELNNSWELLQRVTDHRKALRSVRELEWLQAHNTRQKEQFENDLRIMTRR